MFKSGFVSLTSNSQEVGQSNGGLVKVCTSHVMFQSGGVLVRWGTSQAVS